MIDHFSYQKFGDAQVFPINYLKSFLKSYFPECHKKYVYLNQGSNLYHNPIVVHLFKEFRYASFLTKMDLFLVECAHLSIGNAVCVMFLGTGLSPKF